MGGSATDGIGAGVGLSSIGATRVGVSVGAGATIFGSFGLEVMIVEPAAAGRGTGDEVIRAAGVDVKLGFTGAAFAGGAGMGFAPAGRAPGVDGSNGALAMIARSAAESAAWNSGTQVGQRSVPPPVFTQPTGGAQTTNHDSPSLSTTVIALGLPRRLSEIGFVSTCVLQRAHVNDGISTVNALMAASPLG